MISLEYVGHVVRRRPELVAVHHHDADIQRGAVCGHVDVSAEQVDLDVELDLGGAVDEVVRVVVG